MLFVLVPEGKYELAVKISDSDHYIIMIAQKAL